MPRSSLHRTLRNPIYCGRILWNGEDLPDSHEPIVTPELWRKVQSVLDGRTVEQPAKTREPYPLAGLVRCGKCGCLMSPYTAKGKDDGRIGAGEYTVDPPLSSMRGSGKPSGYYGDGAECGSGAPGPGEWGCRSTPAQWAVGRVTIAWCDGHANSMPRKRMDDKDGNGEKDNGFWNGVSDAAQR